MRMWGVDPKIMCRKHLLGEHVELHMFMGILERGKSIRGYIEKGLVNTGLLNIRHKELVEEMICRGYKHKSPLSVYLGEKVGYVDKNSLGILMSRCELCRQRYDDLIKASEVRSYIESKGRSWPWFHNLGARYDLLPLPIIRPLMKETKPGKKRALPECIKWRPKKLKGRKVLYPKSILEYLGLIIKLKEKLSFAKIKKNKDVQKELEKLIILSKTSLYDSPLIKEEVFYINFKAARQLLLKKNVFTADRFFLDILKRIDVQVEKNVRKCYSINNYMRECAEKYKTIDDAVFKERKQLVSAIIFGHKIMDIVIKTKELHK